MRCIQSTVSVFILFFLLLLLLCLFWNPGRSGLDGLLAHIWSAGP